MLREHSTIYMAYAEFIKVLLPVDLIWLFHHVEIYK